MWVGELDNGAWTWRNEGQLYEFPRSDDGSIRYGNIEGVGWINPTTVVAVSDRQKKQDQPNKRLSETDQSIRVLRTPSPAEASSSVRE